MVYSQYVKAYPSAVEASSLKLADSRAVRANLGLSAQMLEKLSKKSAKFSSYLKKTEAGGEDSISELLVLPIKVCAQYGDRQVLAARRDLRCLVRRE